MKFAIRQPGAEGSGSLGLAGVAGGSTVGVERGKPVRRATSCASRTLQSGFTMAEVLAALLFMAIVIPVALQGLRIASRAGEVADRKRDAARVAERVLNEMIVTTNWNKSATSDVIREAGRDYRWSLQTESWNSSASTIQQLSVEVTYPVQGQDYSVRLSTLANTQ